MNDPYSISFHTNCLIIIPRPNMELSISLFCGSTSQCINEIEEFIRPTCVFNMTGHGFGKWFGQ